MAKPKWLMKPLDIRETDFGFQGGGEGVIYKYNKSKYKYGEPEIYYFVLTNNRVTGRLYLMFRSRSMGMQSIRRNVKIKQDFSKDFKRELFRLTFHKEWESKPLKRALGIIKEL